MKTLILSVLAALFSLRAMADAPLADCLAPLANGVTYRFVVAKDSGRLGLNLYHLENDSSQIVRGFGVMPFKAAQFLDTGIQSLVDGGKNGFAGFVNTGAGAGDIGGPILIVQSEDGSVMLTRMVIDRHRVAYNLPLNCKVFSPDGAL